MSKKPKLTRCKRCPKRLIDDGVGFQPKKRLICTYFDREVRPNDGCTFSSCEDGPYFVKRVYDVDLSEYAAVNGDEMC